jgi:hypothetical protein
MAKQCLRQSKEKMGRNIVAVGFSDHVVHSCFEAALDILSYLYLIYLLWLKFISILRLHFVCDSAERVV